jgi:hypothetical protein
MSPRRMMYTFVERAPFLCCEFWPGGEELAACEFFGDRAFGARRLDQRTGFINTCLAAAGAGEECLLTDRADQVGLPSHRVA